MSVKFNAPIDSLSMTTKTNGDMMIIEIANVHIEPDDAKDLAELINSNEELEVRIKKAGEPE